MAMVIAATLPVACRDVITESAQAFVEDRTLDGIRAAQSQFEDEAHFQRLVRWHGDRARWVLEAWTGVWLDPDFAGWNLDPWLPQVRCPVLAIHGDSDEFGSIAFPERTARGVPGASRIAIMQDCGHVPHRERPDEVSELASVFLRETAAERTP